MLGNRFALLSAELMLMRKRLGVWVLLGVWCILSLVFSYFVAYATYDGSVSGRVRLEQLLPAQLIEQMIDGFPFYGGAIALMLGVLSIGSEFGWDTLKTLFTQRPGRSWVFAAKMGALALALVPFVVVPLALGAVTSSVIALREDAGISWPSLTTLIQAVLGAWLIMAVWAAVGVLLAVATRGTSLAIGIGILYSLVIEGLISMLLGGIDLLQPIIDFFLRANAYSLLRPLGGAGAGEGNSAATDGPGAFNGPYVDEVQALAVLIGYVVVFLGVSLLLLRSRDVA